MNVKTIDKKNIERLIVGKSLDLDLELDTRPCQEIYIKISMLSEAPHLNHDLDLYLDLYLDLDLDPDSDLDLDLDLYIYLDLDLDINHVTLILTCRR